MAEAGTSEEGYMTGQLLVAMPGMADPRFQKSVVYICAHNAEGAMGLVVNKLADSISFPDLLEQMEIESAPNMEKIRVHFGGPVETSRGFVLHSDDYLSDSSMRVSGGLALTATLDILRDMAGGGGPRNRLLALGYAGWGPGQLDEELQENGWLNVSPDEALVFDDDLGNKWDRAVAKLGISPIQLSGDAGHA